MNNISVFSFFSGIGFLDLGFESAGYEVVYSNEVWPEFARGYIEARKKLNITPPKYGMDVRSIDDLLIPEHFERIGKMIANERTGGKLVCFIGGPPCPDFSVAGKNRGNEGENGRLSKTYIDLIVNQKPDIFLFENVKGLWRTRKHRAFYEQLKERLASNGYVLTERLINSIQYGAPQDRDRILLVGFQKHLVPKKQDRLNFEQLFEWDEGVKYELRTAFNHDWPTTNGHESHQLGTVPSELTVQNWFLKNDVENHPNQKHVFKAKAGLAKFTTVLEGDVSRKSYKRLHRHRYSPTAAYGNNEVHIHPTLPRRITAAEALAIQSLPPEFELPADMTLTNMFKSIGNGVPFLVATGIAKAVKNTLVKLKQP